MPGAGYGGGEEGTSTAVIADPHIKLDERGAAWIDDVEVKVIEVVPDPLGYRWSPEEIRVDGGAAP